MGVPNDAGQFLARFASDFEHEVVRAWTWGGEDSDFGKALSWDVQPFAPEAGRVIQVNASVDLQLTQLMLAISERDMEQGALANTDTQVSFDALIQFEDCALVVNGVEREYNENEIRAVLREFNERSR